MKPQPSRSRTSLNEDPLRSTMSTSSSISRDHDRGSRSSLLEQGCIYNMSDCYERLRTMLPHGSDNRRMSKVEILQHVIDYIQDLESALELPHLQTAENFVNQESTDKRQTRIPLKTISYNR